MKRQAPEPKKIESRKDEPAARVAQVVDERRRAARGPHHPEPAAPADDEEYDIEWYAC